MAKRKAADAGSTSDMEKRVLAFAEQIGRIAGTVQAKAEGWLDRDNLNAQLATIRDSASDLLDEIGVSNVIATVKRRGQAGAANVSTAAPSPKRAGTAAARPAAKRAGSAKKPTKMGAASTSGSAGSTTGAARGRSGGAVDAPGKKHRGPTPSESGAAGRPRGEGSRLVKLKAASMNRTRRG
jgi:hypothetical protein